MTLYSAEIFTHSISVADYIASYRSDARDKTGCPHCPNAYKKWSCPPYDFDIVEHLSRYKYALIIADIITPANDVPPGTSSIDLVVTERKKIEKRLLDIEPKYDGRAYTIVGGCTYCGNIPCTRPSGLPCRHPELVRPTLSSFGFDMRSTLKDFFGRDLLFSKNGKLPEYLSLIVGFLHNKPISEDIFLS